MVTLRIGPALSSRGGAVLTLLCGALFAVALAATATYSRLYSQLSRTKPALGEWRAKPPAGTEENAPAAAAAASLPGSKFLLGALADYADSAAALTRAATPEDYVRGTVSAARQRAVVQQAVRELLEEVTDAAVLPLTGVQVAGNNEDGEANGFLPLPSMMRCIVQADGFEVCEYTNVCVDIPGPEYIQGADDRTLYFVTSAAPDPAVAGEGGEAVPAEQEHPNVDRGADSSSSGGAWSSPSSWRRVDGQGGRVSGAAGAGGGKGAAPPVSAATLSRSTAMWDDVFGDAPEVVQQVDAPPSPPAANAQQQGGAGAAAAFWAHRGGEASGSARRQRRLPFASRLVAHPIAPSATVPRGYGGSFAGEVTWLPDAYLAHDLLGPHIWGFSASVVFPVLGAALANASSALGLPPLSTLVVLGFDDSKAAHWHHNTSRTAFAAEAARAGGTRRRRVMPYRLSREGLWSHDLLAHTLAYVRRGVGLPGGSDRARRGAGPHLDWRPFHGSASKPRLYHAYRPRDGPPTAAAPFGEQEVAEDPEEGAGQGGEGREGSPWRRPPTHLGGPAERGDGSAYPHLAALRRLRQAQRGREGAADPGGQAPDSAPVLRIPYHFLEYSPGPTAPGPTAPGTPAAALGTRVVWDATDLPPPPPPAAHLVSGAATREPAVRQRSAGSAGQPREPQRLCLRRAVVLGERFAMVGGGSEANAVRDLGRAELGVPWPEEETARPGSLPPFRALVMDRGGSGGGGAPSDRDGLPLPPRAFANLAGMKRVLERHGVPYDVMDNAQLMAAGLRGAARALAGYGLVIVAHGASEMNLAWLPRRSAVIEVQPYGLWCPLYTRFLGLMGHSVFPIYSRLPGPGLDWGRPWLEDIQLEAIKQGLPEPEALPPGKQAEVSAFCESMSLVEAANSNCYHGAKTAAVMTPLLELEHVLLRALEVIGVKRGGANTTSSSLFDVMEGRDGGTGGGGWVPGGSDTAPAAAAVR